VDPRARGATHTPTFVVGIRDHPINGSFLFDLKGTPAEYGAGLKLAIARGWLEMHESGAYVKFTQTGAELFA
jgi:hypothetical protein